MGKRISESTQPCLATAGHGSKAPDHVIWRPGQCVDWLVVRTVEESRCGRQLRLSVSISVKVTAAPD